MNYKLLYTTWYGSQRKVVVFDFNQGLKIEFTMDELENKQLDPLLKKYIYEIKDTIDSGIWDYTE